MTKYEYFGLSFINWINPTDKRNRKICQKLKIDVNSELQLLNSLNIRETESLINDNPKYSCLVIIFPCHCQCLIG